MFCPMLPPDTWLFLRSNINYFGVSLVPIFWILNQFAVLLKQITAYQWQFRLQINSSRASSALIVLFLQFGWKSQFRARRTYPWNTQNPLLVFVCMEQTRMREESERGKKRATLRLYIEQRLRKNAFLQKKKKSNKLLFASIQPNALLPKKGRIKNCGKKNSTYRISINLL